MESGNHADTGYSRPNCRSAKVRKLVASGEFRPPQLIASNCVLSERSLVAGVRRSLGGGHTGCGTTNYPFGMDESGNLGIAIVVRHDLPLLAG